MDNLLNIIKERPLFIPRVLLKNYHTLGITEEELLIIIILMDYGDKVTYDPESFANMINGDKKNIMRIIDSLCDKNIISLVIEKNNKKTHEYLSLDSLYEKLFNIVTLKEEESVIDDSVFSVFESELGRTLSPMEYEKIKEWITSDNSKELISRKKYEKEIF